MCVICQSTVNKCHSLIPFRVIYSLMIIFAILCLIFFVILQDVRNLVSLSGMVLLFLISIAISKHPGKVSVISRLCIHDFHNEFNYPTFSCSTIADQLAASNRRSLHPTGLSCAHSSNVPRLHYLQIFG